MITKTSPFSALQFKDFRNYWIALFASQIGLQTVLVGVNWQLYTITHSAFSLGLVGLMGFLPILVFSLPSGVIADRVNRIRLMMTNQCIWAISISILAFTTLFGVITPTLIYVILLINAVVLTFDLPARQAIINTLVPKEHFMKAVSIMTLARQSSIIIGPMIAGFIIEYLGIQSIYFFAVGALVVSLITMSQIKVTEEKRAVVPLNLASILEGVHFVRKSPMIASTMWLDFFATFFSSAMTLLPIFAKEVLGSGVSGLGPLYAAPSIGAVTAGLTFSSMHNVKNQGKIILLSVLLYGLATVGFGLSRIYALSLFFLAIVGAADMVSMVIRNTLRQMLTPDYIRGRMSSVNMIFFAGGPQLGEVESGILAASIGAPASVVIGGVATVVAVVWIGFAVPRLWKYQGEVTQNTA